ncbi:MAG: HAD hydrolase family protein, partial [Bacillota bacterium]
MEIKAFVSDVDKTLTDDNLLLDIDAIQTIRCLEAAGIPVVLVTARDYMTAASLSIFLGACGLVAAENGSVLWNMRSGKSPQVLGSKIRIASGLSVLQTCLGDLVQIYNMPGRLCSAVV